MTEKTHKLWLRVGVTMEVPEADAKELQKDIEGYAKRALAAGTAVVDGDTYFPETPENRAFSDATGADIISE